jgi:probable F420-dependent oxidoreductase
VTGAAKSIAIGMGLMEFPFSSASAFWRWVDQCEAGGVDSIWQTDRLVSKGPILECMAAMAALAGRTKRLKFGMNVVSLAMRDPVLLAKQCATIDFLSGGRLLPGFGIGSPLAPEWKTLHLDPATRGRKTDECLEIIHRLWTEEEVDFQGKHFQLSGVSIAPKPVQVEIPMWIGGGSDAAVRRTARYGTGWQGGPETPAEAAEVVARIRAAAIEAGRAIDDDHYGAAFAFRFGTADEAGVVNLMEAYRKRTGRDARERFAIGGTADIVARIGEFVDAGVSKFILRPAAQGDEDFLDQSRRLIEHVLPAVAARWPKPPKRVVVAA